MMDGVRVMQGLGSLMRRKQVDSVHTRRPGDHQLSKELSVLQLIAIGVGATVGAGVYVLVGTVAREHSGPALCISFLIAGLASALSALCYAELASRCPSAGSAYHYSYICVGEVIAWLIGWAVTLEYTIGGSAVARGITPNLAFFFGGEDSLPTFLARAHIPWLNVMVDPCAAIFVLIFTGLLCVGIKASSFVQAIVTTANICAMAFVIVAGGYLCFRTGWIGYSLPKGYFPFGLNGMLYGSATLFFAYIGFDSVASTAEEVKNPQRDLPMGIGLSLSICCILYMMVAFVVVGLVPYFAIDADTPISSAFVRHGIQWAAYIIAAGAVMALCSALMGSLLPQPRILMAMARDGLLPSFFSDVNKHTQVPVKSTLLTGFFAAILAFCMDVSQLAGMVSVGTLLAFTAVAVCILVLRYVPPNMVPLHSLLPDSDESVLSRYDYEDNERDSKAYVGNRKDGCGSVSVAESWIAYPLMGKEMVQADMLQEKYRRKLASLSIGFACLGVLLLTSGASAAYLPSPIKFPVCVVGGLLIICALIVLSWIDQDDARHTFGHTGGFACPCVPVLPVCCILINVYLLVNLGTGTWIRISIWQLVGLFVYLFYGRTHSCLKNVVYVSSANAEKICRNSGYVA